MNTLPQVSLLALLIACAPVFAADGDEGPGTSVTIRAPYLDMHTGPGRGFKVENSALRGETVDVLERQTDWYRVRTPRGAEGWIHRRSLSRQESPDASLDTTPEVTPRNGSLQVYLGSFDGAGEVSAGGEIYVLSQTTVGIDLARGNDKTRDIGKYSFEGRQHFDAIGRSEPWLGAGVSFIDISPDHDVPDGQSAHASAPFIMAGIDWSWRARTLLRLEFRRIIPNVNSNALQESSEWKAGIVVPY